MGKSPLILAALANDAVPSFRFTQVQPLSNNSDGLYDAALLTEAGGEHYVVKMARTQQSALTLDTELVALRSIGADVRNRLPFEITRQVGETKDSRGKRAILLTFLYGDPLDLTMIHSGDSEVASLAASVAAIHSLPTSIVENSGLPSFSPAEIIHEHVGKLDRAAKTGMVPSALLHRWETALEDVSLFRFNPCVVHGDLVGDNVLTLDGEISGILSWSHLRVGDPAQDLSWIVGAGNPDASYNTLLEYNRLRGAAVDDNVKQRATLYSELAIASWLAYGLAHNDDGIVQEAQGELEALLANLEETGSLSLQPKSLGNTAETVLEMPADHGVSADLNNPADFVDLAQSVVSNSFVGISTDASGYVSRSFLDEAARDVVEDFAKSQRETLLARSDDHPLWTAEETSPIPLAPGSGTPGKVEEIIDAEIVYDDEPGAEPFDFGALPTATPSTTTGENYDHEKLFAETAPIDLPADLPDFLTEEPKAEPKDGELF